MEIIIYNELNNFDIDVGNDTDEVSYDDLYPNDTDETGEPVYIEVKNE